MRQILAIFILLLLGACADLSPAVTPTSTSRPEPTALPPLDEWTPPAAPITPVNIRRIRQIGRLDAPEPPSTLFAYALSLDNAYLAALNNDFLIVWDLVLGEIISGSERLGANVVLFGPDRQQIYTLTADGELRIYGVADGSRIKTLRVFDQYNGVWAYDPIGGWLAVGSESGSVQVWDMMAGAPVNQLEGPASPLASMAFSADGTLLAVAHTNGTVKVWDFVDAQVTASADLMTPAARILFAPSGRSLVLESGDGVLILSAATAQVIYGLTGTANSGLLGFFGQADRLMTGGANSDITLWDTTTGSKIANLPGTQGERPSASASPGGEMLITSTRTTTAFWNLTGLDSGSVLRGSTSLPEMDIFRTVWTGDGLQILLFEAIGPIHVMGIAD